MGLFQHLLRFVTTKTVVTPVSSFMRLLIVAFARLSLNDQLECFVLVIIFAELALGIYNVIAERRHTRELLESIRETRAMREDLHDKCTSLTECISECVTKIEGGTTTGGTVVKPGKKQRQRRRRFILRQIL